MGKKIDKPIAAMEVIKLPIINNFVLEIWSEAQPKKPVNKSTTKIVITGLLVAALEKKFVKSFIVIKVNLKKYINVFINVKYM